MQGLQVTKDFLVQYGIFFHAIFASFEENYFLLKIV